MVAYARVDVERHRKLSIGLGPVNTQGRVMSPTERAAA